MISVHAAQQLLWWPQLFLRERLLVPQQVLSCSGNFNNHPLPSVRAVLPCIQFDKPGAISIERGLGAAHVRRSPLALSDQTLWSVKCSDKVDAEEQRMVESATVGHLAADGARAVTW